MRVQPQADYRALSDVDLAGRIARRDEAAVRLVAERNNQRLFRAAWSILRDRDQAEDAVQSAYLKAFTAIGSFAGRSSLSTWLTRIVINEALGRKRAEKRRRARVDQDSVLFLADYKEKLMRGSASCRSPEISFARAEIRQMLESAIARLPDPFRLVFVLREIEDMNVAEVAEALGIAAATVKTRHFRARRRLQEELAPELKNSLAGTFPFAGVDCERVTSRIIREYCGAR